MKKRILSLMMSVSLVVGTISVNATSIVFEDIDKPETIENNTPVQIEMEELESVSENSLINFDELETNISEEVSTPLEAINYETSIQSNDEWNFSYTGNIQEWTTPESGKYYIEIYGASGGGVKVGDKGGFSGKTNGYINLLKGQKLYIVLGQQGAINGLQTYNGGGSGGNGAGAGGGASHIAYVSGELKSLENNKEQIICVAGGGGGQNSVPHYKGDSHDRVIGSGGGLNGGVTENASGGSQIDGYSFGLGQNANGSLDWGGAGGGGFYGGYASHFRYYGGGGGSGYIGGLYNASTTSSSNIIGNGFAKIIYQGPVSSQLILNIGNNATYNDKSGKIILEGNYGETITLKDLVLEDGYSFLGYKLIDGEDNLVNNTYHFGTENSEYKAIFEAPLKLEVSTKDIQTQGYIKLHWEQNDEIDKTYVVKCSTDGTTWYDIYSNDNSYTSQYGKTYSSKGSYVFTSKVGGIYQIEAYGAQGENGYSSTGGKGAYVTGDISLNAGESLYITVGGSNGYNGGGNASYSSSYSYGRAGRGGGATSITTSNRGVLSNFANYKNEILIVAAGGGGYYGGGGGGSGYMDYANSSSCRGYNGSRGSFGQGGNGGSSFSAYSWHAGQGGGGGGGSSYTNSALSNTSITNGLRAGDGMVKIFPTSLYTEIAENTIGVYVKDTKAPNTPSSNKITTNGAKLRIEWNDVDDNGNEYYHKVNSYDTKGNLLKESVINKSESKTGVWGYYYYIDANESGSVTIDNGINISENFIEIISPNTKSYIHVAAIDGAGNLSNTYSFEIPSIASYTVKHYKMDLNGNYVLDETITNSATIGTSVTPEVKTYEGFKTPKEITEIVLANGSTLIEYYYERNKYAVTYIDKTLDGKEIGRTEKLVYYDTDVRGSELGDDSADNAYYLQHKYISDTIAKVTTDGATVYRIFEFCETEKESHLTWNDNNDADKLRPEKYTLKLKQNGIVIDEVELPSEQTDYTFPELPKYDEAGNPYHYTFDVDASDRYQINFDNDGNLIIEDYQPANFSVIIPKQIILDGRTGEASYTVSVDGTFYYNDTLTITPEKSFILTDRSNISTMKANVSLAQTQFQKEDVNSVVNGTISTNKRLFAGKWRGYFNFDIKFVMNN